MNQTPYSSPVADPVLVQSPLFADLSALEYNAVTAFLERRHIKKSEVLFREGEKGEEMFILLSGKLGAEVAQSDGTMRWMFDTPRGDFFGEMSIIANEPRSATLTAKEDSDLMVLQGIDFYRIIFDHPIIGLKLLKAIARLQNKWLENNSKHLKDLMSWGEEASRRAVTDELTGLNNRRYLEDSIKARFANGAVGLRKISLLMIDLDRVHTVNEKYGVRAGDEVIKAAAEVLKKHARSGDIAARLSGDEFAVLFPDTDQKEAFLMAEAIRKGISGCRVPVPEPGAAGKTLDLEIRASIGIAVAPAHAATREGLIIAADNALHSAKERGRNRVEIAGLRQR